MAGAGDMVINVVVDEKASAAFDAILSELRAIRALLEPQEIEGKLDPVAVTANAQSVAELQAAGLWRRK